MSDPKIPWSSNRSQARLPLVADVVLGFQAEPVCGSGRNISQDGVYFIAPEEVRVTVRMGGHEMRGVVVRLENHGKGHTGIAVRFDRDDDE